MGISKNINLVACQTERSRSLDKGGHISTPLNLTYVVFRGALKVSSL